MFLPQSELPLALSEMENAPLRQLIDEVNTDPRRGFGHEKVLTQIKVDDVTKNIKR